MTNIMDYLTWRGDLRFTQDPPNALDALVFASLCYLRLCGDDETQTDAPISLKEVAQAFQHQENSAKTVHLELLEAAAKSERFGSVSVLHYREKFLPEQDTQFAAVTFRLDDGSLFVAFRGTDSTLVGWKEDFSMCFRQTVPAQRRALDYTCEIANRYSAPLYLCGHSKGGNMAVFAAARSSPMHQENICGVYNFDGPGFSDYMMGDVGYLAMVPKIHTYVPQSSVIGMIMDREEPVSIVHSSASGIWQHDTYSWDVVGKSFVSVEETTVDSKFMKQTIKNWLASMNSEERGCMVETLFDLLTTGDVDELSDILSIKTLRSYLKVIGDDDITRRVLVADLIALFTAAKQAAHQLGENQNEHEKLREPK